VSRPGEHAELTVGAGSYFGPDDRDDDSDVGIDAAATADEVRHREQPRASVRVVGTGEVEETNRIERKNVPAGVEPGRPYRGVRVRRRTSGRLRSAPPRTPEGG
jgi:hypothetical protein